MSALVNFKICDNAPECGGVAVCPTEAMYFDEGKKTIIVDEEKCINCGLCENECPIGAIMVPKSNDEYILFEKYIEEDPRTIEDLFVDRFGAATVSEFFTIDKKQFYNKINNDKLTMIELYDSEIAECLLKSIPIKDISKEINEETFFYKIDKEMELVERYNIQELPVLMFFKNNELLGKIEGYHSIDQFDDLKSKLKNIEESNKIFFE